MFFKVQSYITFILKSTNQHGVHSPFVFDLVTKCFYDRTAKEWDVQLKKANKNQVGTPTLKNARLLVRILYYCKIKNVLILENKPDYTNSIFRINPYVILFDQFKDAEHFDLIYAEAKYISKHTKIVSTLFSKAHNDSMLILSGIHDNQINEDLWKTIVNTAKVTVTIDSYDFGFVFFRKQQAKEHFVIRL